MAAIVLVPAQYRPSGSIQHFEMAASYLWLLPILLQGAASLFYKLSPSFLEYPADTGWISESNLSSFFPRTANIWDY